MRFYTDDEMDTFSAFGRLPELGVSKPSSALVELFCAAQRARRLAHVEYENNADYNYRSSAELYRRYFWAGRPSTRGPSSLSYKDALKNLRMAEMALQGAICAESATASKML